MGQYKHIHTKHIDAIAGGDNLFLIELIDIFLSQIPGFVSTMQSSLAEKKLTVLAREAHTAKSSVLTFGMEATGNLLKMIQIKAEANELEDVPALVNEAITQMEEAIPDLLELKASIE